MPGVSQVFKQWLIAILLLIFSGTGIAFTEYKTDVAEHKTDIETHKQAKHLMAQFGKTLKAELMQAVKQGSLENGVKVCSQRANQIASELSVDGWQIKRVSLKSRNPDNAPDDWETMILRDFDKRNMAGESAASLFVAKTLSEVSGTPQFRAMKAIPTQALCLSCHGAQLAPKVTDTIQKYYPNDQAKGYNVGDIRGAFSLIKSQ